MRFDYALMICQIIGVGIVAYFHDRGYVPSENFIVVGLIYLIGIAIGFVLYRIYRLLRYGERTFLGE
jgi:hypothetical protein